MSFQTPSADLPTPPVKTYISLPPEREAAAPVFSAGFVIFAIFVIGGAGLGGAVQSGRISLNRFFNAPKAVVRQAPVQTVARHAAPAPSAAPVPPLKPGTFVVSSISIGAPSFAIINGISRVEGDPVEAPGVTGWKVRLIVDGAVVLQNGSTLTSLPLSTPGIQPLDDQLKPLN
jgi:hypothetical protein